MHAVFRTSAPQPKCKCIRDLSGYYLFQLQQVGIDLVGPLPTTKRGNKYIITMCDYFTKWPEARAVPDKTARTVADFLYWTMTRNGCAEIQISDQGREFVNQVSRELHLRTGKYFFISIYYTKEYRLLIFLLTKETSYNQTSNRTPCD